MTAIPDTGTWYNGPLNTEPQQYDVLVAARGNVIIDKDPKIDLIVTPYEVPDFFELKNGQIVVTQQPAGAITMPKGCQGIVEIQVSTINRVASLNENLLGLGVREKIDGEYSEIICDAFANRFPINLPLQEMETLEFIPLICKQHETDYIRAGEIYPYESMNWGASIRIKVNVKLSGNSWFKDISSRDIRGYRYTIGPVVGEDGKVLNNRIVTGNYYSSNALAWNPIAENNNIEIAVYGNGIWCGFSITDNDKYSMVYSTDFRRSWKNSEIEEFTECGLLAFGNGIFMMIDLDGLKDGIIGNVNISQDAQKWEKYDNPLTLLDIPTEIVYGNDIWVVVGLCGRTSISKDNGRSWENSGDELFDNHWTDWHGNCFAHGYFYIVNDISKLIVRSKDGINWKKVITLNHISLTSLTYYRNRLYAISDRIYTVALFRPDGTIDLEFDDEGNPI